MPDAIILFVGPRKFMFFDRALQIFLTTGGSDEPNLAVVGHDLAIQIKGRLFVLAKCAVANELLEILFAFGVNGRRVNVCARWQINFRLADVKETEGVAL